MGLFSQKDLLQAIEKAERRLIKEKKIKKKQNQINKVKFEIYRQILFKMLTNVFFGGCY